MEKQVQEIIGEIKMPKIKGGEYIWKGRCPFCNKKHNHNVGHELEKINDAMGLRNAHCSNNEDNSKKYLISIKPGWKKEFEKHEINKMGKPRPAARRSAEETRELILESDEEI